MSGALGVTPPAFPPAATLTSVVARVTRSRTNMSGRPLRSPSTRFGASDQNATKRRAGCARCPASRRWRRSPRWLAALPGSPVLDTLTRNADESAAWAAGIPATGVLTNTQPASVDLCDFTNGSPSSAPSVQWQMTAGRLQVRCGWRVSGAGGPVARWPDGR
jgi:hypothetical protein